MSRKSLATAMLCVVLLLAARLEVPAATRVGKNSDEKLIRSLIAQMMDDWNRHDMQSFMSHFTEDSDVVTRTGQWFQGRAKHEEHLVELHASPFRDQLIGRISRVEGIRFITSQVAVAHESVEEKTGKSIRTYLLSKRNGQWRVESDTVSVIGNPTGDLNAVARSEDANAVLDKAVRALGGEEKLSVIQAATWKTKGTISFGGHDNSVSTQWTLQGLDHLRHAFEIDFGGNTIKGINVVAGGTGWRGFGDSVADLQADAIANLKRHAYLAMIQITPLALKGPQFKVEAVDEEQIAGKPAATLRAIGPDGKDFTLHFDKGTGLPIKLEARVADFDGHEYAQETTLSDYRDMGGIKRPTRIQLTRDGQRFQEHQLTDFQILDQIDPITFARPQESPNR